MPCGDARARETSHAGVCGRAHDFVLITAFIFHFLVAATSFRRRRASRRATYDGCKNVIIH